LRIYRDRARLVLLACRRILADREIEDDPRDLMAMVVSMREQAAQLGDDASTTRRSPGSDRDRRRPGRLPGPRVPHGRSASARQGCLAAARTGRAGRRHRRYLVAADPEGPLALLGERATLEQHGRP
jgi:hypothetical protein